MRRLRALAFIAMLLMPVVGCKPSQQARERAASELYRAAWDKRSAGDPVGHRAMLEQIAKQYPGTRAGERAHRFLSAKDTNRNGLLVAGAGIGLAAAIAIPWLIEHYYGQNALMGPDAPQPERPSRRRP